MSDQKPSVGRIVHYVSYGTPPAADGSQAFTSQCRAAIVTEVGGYGDEVADDAVGLFVANPTGVFLNREVPHDEDRRAGGTWHWPERV
jgi:hypothetical protein